MGWDADSGAYDWSNQKFERTEYKEIFAEAVKYVIEECGSVDSHLEFGCLGCTRSRLMLERATGERCMHVGWHAEFVKDMNAAANWHFMVDDIKDDGWAYWSARKFLEACAQLNLCISFD